jgi:predicted ATPase
LHGRIAEVLEREFPELRKTQPEMLGRHCAEAGLAEEAIHYYVAASQRATAASNNKEASGHIRRAHALLETLPPSSRVNELRHRIMMCGWWGSA